MVIFKVLTKDYDLHFKLSGKAQIAQWKGMTMWKIVTAVALGKYIPIKKITDFGLIHCIYVVWMKKVIILTDYT